MKYNRYNVLSMVGHVCTDINQGALPAILPFLVLYKNISYTSAAGLIFAVSSVSSIIQPLFGYLGDRMAHPWLMGLGALLAGGGLTLVGFCENYWGMFFAVCVSGIGVALFHPEGGRLANLAAGEHKGASMAFFAVGGNIGFALGPVVASVALSTMGLHGTAVFLIPGLSLAVVMLVARKNLNRLAAESHRAKTMRKQGEDVDDWNSFIKVSACLATRSAVTYGLSAFIPLYFAAVMLMPEASASSTLTLYSSAAAVATLCGGMLADRFGFTKVIRGGYVLLVPLLFILPLIASKYLAIFLLIPLAMTINAPQGAMIALGQRFLPNHIGTSSGIMMGLAVSIGGMISPGIGWVGDHYGLPAAMYVIAGFGALTMVLAFLIPGRPQKK